MENPYDLIEPTEPERASKDSSGYAIGRPSLAKVRYTHDAMIDMILANPGISQSDLAKFFGYRQPWISNVMSSDSFRMRLSERKAELVDPTLLMSIEERFKALASRSVEKLMDHLNQPTETIDPEILIKAAALGAKSIGLGQPKQDAPTGSTEDHLKDLSWKLTRLLHKSKEDSGTIDVKVIESDSNPGDTHET